MKDTVNVILSMETFFQMMLVKNGKDSMGMVSMYSADVVLLWWHDWMVNQSFIDMTFWILSIGKCNHAITIY